MQWQNTVEGYCDWIGENVCKKISEYLEENTLWVRRKIRQHRRMHYHDHAKSNKYGADDNATIKNGNPYWHHVSLFYDQLQGLEDGYDARVKEQTKVCIVLNLVFETCLDTKSLYVLRNIITFTALWIIYQNLNKQVLYRFPFLGNETWRITAKNTTWRHILYEHLWGFGRSY